MPSSDPVRRLEDILANIRRIEEHTSGVADLSAFAQDALVYDAVERCLERISEAVRIPGDGERDSGVNVKSVPGEGEPHSGLKVNGDSDGKANGFFAFPGIVFTMSPE